MNGQYDELIKAIWSGSRTDGELLGMTDYGFTAVGVNLCRFLGEN